MHGSWLVLDVRQLNSLFMGWLCSRRHWTSFWSFDFLGLTNQCNGSKRGERSKILVHIYHLGDWSYDSPWLTWLLLKRVGWPEKSRFWVWNRRRSPETRNSSRYPGRRSSIDWSNSWKGRQNTRMWRGISVQGDRMLCVAEPRVVQSFPGTIYCQLSKTATSARGNWLRDRYF